MKNLLATAGCATTLGAIVLACSGSVGAPRGGLVVTVANDGSLAMDHFKVQITAGNQVLLQNEFATADTSLPNDVSIVSNGTGTTTATIVVSAWLNGKPVDERDAVVSEIPSDRVASLGIVLSGRCAKFVMAGADPATAVSTCPSGQTCSLDGGQAHCASDAVDASTLPTYGSGEPAIGTEGGAGSGSGSEDGGDGGSAVDAGPKCTEGALTCDGLQPQKCMHNAFVGAGAPCDFVCTSGICTGQCKPSTKQCPDAFTTQTCDTSGQWSAPTRCGADSDAGDGGASGFCNGAGLCGGCQAGTTKCNGNGVETCTPSGAWGATVACTNACYQGGCTGICTPGTSQCVMTTPQLCSSVGSWVNQPIMSGVCAATCTPGSSQCSGTTPQTCNASGTGYLNGSVMAGVCGAKCTPGNTQCVGTTPQTCNSSGAWVSQPITKGTCSATCTPNTTQCAGTTQQTCNGSGSGWNNNAVTQGVCGAVCTPNQLGCGNSEQSSFCGGAGCWWVWSNETVYQETCNAAGAWGAAVTCTGKCMHPTNGQQYYNCSTNHGGCISGGTCQSN